MCGCRGILLNKSPYVSEWIEKYTNELNSRYRSFIAQTLSGFASDAQIDESAVLDSLEQHGPDVSDIQRKVAAQTAVKAILYDAALEEIALSTVTKILDECLRKTFAESDFAETFLDNFESAMLAETLAPELTEQMSAFVEQREVPKVIEDFMRQLAEQTKVPEEIAEDFGEFARERPFAENVQEALAAFATRIDIASLLAERSRHAVKRLELMASLDQQVKKRFSQMDVEKWDRPARDELDRAYNEVLERLCRDIETERFRHLPWDQFIDLTYGILADDPIERPESVAPAAMDDLE